MGGIYRAREPQANVHGGYEGDLLLQTMPGALLQLPLRVRVQFSGVKTDEIITRFGRKNADRNADKYAGEMWHATGGMWSSRMTPPTSYATNCIVHVLSGTPIRETLAETETVLPALESGFGCVHFGFPRCQQFFARTEANSLLARYEVVDANDRVLARGIVPQMPCVVVLRRDVLRTRVGDGRCRGGSSTVLLCVVFGGRFTESVPFPVPVRHCRNSRNDNYLACAADGDAQAFAAATADLEKVDDPRGFTCSTAERRNQP